MGRQVKLNCPRLPVPFTYTDISIYNRGSTADRRGCDGQVSRIARGCEKLSGGEQAGEP